MKLTMIMITGLVLLCILILGCQEENLDKAPDERLMNSKLIDIYSDSSIQNAIISEHTLFPYHFVKNGADLNELGQRDLAVLTSHFARNGGHLNIRRLGTSAGLYEARVSVVCNVFKDAGIDMARISASDVMSGGSGMLSDRQLGASAGLSEANTSEVRNALLGAGINTTGISISDGMPGGSGMPSERVLIILEQGTEGTGTETSTSYSPEMR